MTNIGLFYLIKIGKKKYMHELYKHGVVFMNDINYFRQCEDNELRGDKEEGIKGIEQVADIKLLLKGKVLAHGGSGQLKFYENNGNIYSLMAITSLENPVSFQIDEKNKRFGDCFVVITEVKDFINRIEDKLKKLKFEYEYSLVRYYNLKKHSGPLDVFCKPDNFKYQRELRFFLKRKEANPLIFEIGSIKNTSYIFEINKLDKISIKFS